MSWNNKGVERVQGLVVTQSVLRKDVQYRAWKGASRLRTGVRGRG